MRSRGTWYEMNRFLDTHLSPMVKWLIIINTVMLVLYMIIIPIASRSAFNWFMQIFGQQPNLSILHGMVWQFVTYMFIHLGPFHFLVNMRSDICTIICT